MPKFQTADPFYIELKRRVALHFEGAVQGPQDVPGMYVKSAFILAWFAASYLLLMFVAATWWQAVPLALSLGFAAAAIGMNVQHDANHGGYSRHRAVNRFFGFTLDMLGASSYVWSFKHNVFHHTYTNIQGADSDINAQPFSRFAPEQKRRLLHRFQPLYVWLLYGVLPTVWQFFDDFRMVAIGKVDQQEFPRPKGWQMTAFVLFKLQFYAWVVVIPVLVHPAGSALALYAIASGTLGITLSITFQLAHCLEEAEFPKQPADGRMETPWAQHEIETTVDFAQGNRFLTWYLGGLNYQIEHHLFPKICHLHYPAIAPIVEATCKEFGLRYRSHRTMRGALASHIRWMGKMGTQGGLAEA